jgi:choline dehydrogenase-like flavoprotein
MRSPRGRRADNSGNCRAIGVDQPREPGLDLPDKRIRRRRCQYARRRPNLTIQTNALTECLLLEGKRCVGVRYNMNGQQHEARANREVVVSTGIAMALNERGIPTTRGARWQAVQVQRILRKASG